jgi:hypothetical protein
MPIWKPKNSTFYRYDFWLGGRRFHGPTDCTARKEAKAVEAVEREKAKELVKAMKRSQASLLIDDVAARLWTADAQYDADPAATSKNISRLVAYFGKTRSLTDIDHGEAKKMVAWRRGHHVKDRKKASLIPNATVNRSATKMLQRLFTFAKDEGAIFEREPKWTELLLSEPVERVRELQDDEAARLMKPCAPTTGRSLSSSG